MPTVYYRAIKLEAIGVIHTPFRDLDSVPVTNIGGKDIRGQIIMQSKYSAGLRDLEGFSHLILLYNFHMSKGYTLTTKPFMEDQERGLFATRSPKRPNPIGLTVVRLESIEGRNILNILDVDMIDGTPLLDIKPYIPKLDARDTDKIGWLSSRAEKVYGMRTGEA